MLLSKMLYLCGVGSSIKSGLIQEAVKGEEDDLLREMPSKIDLGEEFALKLLTELGELLVENADLIEEGDLGKLDKRLMNFGQIWSDFLLSGLMGIISREDAGKNLRKAG